jgi:putative endopeptidase
MAWQDEISLDIKPGDDFYGYVNKKWRDANPIPDNKSRVAAFTVLNDENMERLKALLEKKGKNNDTVVNIQRLKAFYRAAMDEEAIAKVGIKPVLPLLDDIRKITTAADLERFIITQHSRGFSCVWSIGRDIDDKDSSRYVPRMTQGGLGLPDRDYYFDRSERLMNTRKQYRQFLKQFFLLVGSPRPVAQADEVIALERQLAKASATAVERRDPETMYNLFKIRDLNTQFASFDWKTYFSQIHLSKAKDVVISQPQFVREALKLLHEKSIATWQSYLTFHTLLPLMDKLPKAYEDLKFDFYGRKLQGAKKPEPRYRRIIGLCFSLLSQPLGQLFVMNHFDESAKKEIHDLVAHLQKAFRIRIEKLDWMSEKTKKRALVKLNRFLPLLGYPDKWEDYSSWSISHSYVQNYLALAEFTWSREAERIMGPVDMHEWHMSPALVNATYSPNRNTITFPAGILQPPFFDSTGDFAANYGAIGVVIGHEMTHGFDDEGSQFDENNNMRSWWGQDDRKVFMSRARKLEKQFSSYKVDGRNINGKLTVGENIADLGGLVIAYDGLETKLVETNEHTKIEGFTPEQRFFLGYARIWRQNIRPELALRFLMSDPHSPGESRTNGVVTNCDAFYEAFNVKPGDTLYKPQSKRVRIW